MTAHAVLRCDLVGARHSLTRLRSHGPLVLRPTHPKGFEPWAHRSAIAGRASLSAGAAAPLGGDHLSLDIHVGPGAVLVLNEISATIALPGTRGERSQMTFTVRVEDGGTLIWLPEPVIAARGCDHQQSIFVDLAASARFHLREELIIGRHDEAPGNVEQHLRVVRDERPVYDQTLRLGPRYPGWDSPSVTERAKAVGTMIIIDPDSGIGRDRTDVINANAVSVGLDDDTVQTTAVAADHLELRHALDAALTLVGPPWSEPLDHEKKTAPTGPRERKESK